VIKHQSNISNKFRRIYGGFHLLDHFLGRARAFEWTRKLRTKYYNGLYDSLSRGEPGQIVELERRRNLSHAEFKREYLDKNKPVVLENAASSWDCVKNWSFEYFNQIHGQDKIVVVDQAQEDNPYEVLTLGQLLMGLQEGLSRYYRFYPLIKRHPEHLLDFDYKWLQERRHQNIVLENFQVFFGPADSYTPLHNASAGNLFTQVHGQKEWVIYSNEYLPVIDPSPIKSNYRSAPYRMETGPFNPFEPDYSPPYHLYKYINGYRTVLNPGDVLFNPPYYWHAVRNIGRTIGVGYRWLPLGNTFRTDPVCAFLDLCTTNPPFWKNWKLSQIDPNLTHLAETGQLDHLRKMHKDL